MLVSFLARMVARGCDNPIGAAPAMTTAVAVAVPADGNQIGPVVIMAVAPTRAHVMGLVPV